MITISASEALLGAALLFLVEISIHLRFKPLRIKLETIEHLLRTDHAEIFHTVSEHGERLNEHDERLFKIESRLSERPPQGR